MTILEWFKTAFEGFDPSQVEGMNIIGGIKFGSARLLSSAGTGSLQVTCGGDAIVQFSHDRNIRCSVLLIRDDTAGQEWDYLTRSGQHAPHGRPFATLRLAHTA
jgi:hypothetical protein